MLDGLKGMIAILYTVLSLTLFEYPPNLNKVSPCLKSFRASKRFFFSLINVSLFLFILNSSSSNLTNLYNLSKRSKNKQKKKINKYAQLRYQTSKTQNFMFVAFSLGVNMLLQISNAGFTTERDVQIALYVYSTMYQNNNM